MPRRKPVNPQPKLKQEDEKEDAKTGSKTGDGDNGEPPQKKALLETPGEEGATYDPTCDMNPNTAMCKSEEKKTSKTEISQDGVPEIIIKSNITKLKTEDKVKAVESTSAVGQSSSVMKSNQSLQALFEAAHSELENISKQGDCDANSAITQPAVVQVTVPKVADLTSALNSGQIVIIQCDSLDPDKKSGPQVLQQLVIDKKGTNKFHLPAAMSNIKLVAAEKPLDHVYGTTATEATPGDGFGYKVNETLKPMLVESTFVVPRLPMETIVAMQMPTATSVGRKRKHPQKPGKHICPYCSRGCAKPSVLQKHIRAHTGERPYPCTPCGFSFKTKSNLYKHCKSRAHTIKMGLLNAPPNTNNSTAPKEVMGAVISDGSEEEVTPESPVVEENMEAFVPKTMQGAGQKLCSDDSDNQVIVVQPECAIGETMTPKSSSAGMKAVDSDCQYYDVTLMMADGTLQTISLPAQLVVPGTPKNQMTTTAATTTSQIIITRNPDEKPAENANANSQIDGVVTSVKNSVVGMPSVSDGKLYSTTAVKTDVATTIQLPRQTSCNSRVRLTPIVQPSGDKALPMASGSSQPISRAGLTPEMLHDRITQLISSNAAIVDTPMADAPRPKRVSRHNSMFEPILISSPQVTIATALILPNSSTQVLPLEAARKPAKLTPVKSNGSNFLGQVEPTDQPPGGLGNLPSSTSGPGLTFTTLPATNEIKIEIRLPKPATTVGTACSPVNISPSVSGTGQSVTESGQSGGITAPVMAVEHSVIKDLLLKGRSQSLPSNVELVTPGGVSVASELSHTNSSLKCVACHQTFCDASSLDQHMKQSCPAKPGQVFVVKAPEPTLLCSDNTTIVTSSMPVITPSVTTATKPNMKTHTVVMTTAMTGGSTMLLEVVDPTVPPKRGRPKGSRNSYNSPVSKPSPPPNPALFPTYPSLAPRPPKDSQTDSTPLKPPGRPPRPVLRLKIPPPHGFASNHVTKGTQSAGLSPGSSSDLPTTPITSFAKLKLKGKILMKRSMSVERMLLQDKSGSSAGSAVSSLHLSSVQTAPIQQKFLANLRRCESLDESMPFAKRVRLQEQPDSGKLDSLLYKMLMKGLISSTPGGSTTNFMTSPVSMATKPAVQATPSTSDAPDVIIIDDGPTDDDPHPPDSSVATLEVFTYPPVNVGMTIAARLAVATVAPFARGISADVMLHFPSVESLPDNLMSGIPGLLLRVVTGCARKTDSLSMPDTGGTVKEKVGATPDPDVEPEGENGSVKTSDSAKTDLTLTDARPKILKSATKCSAELPVGIAEKAAAVQLLLSHSYPILCNRTHVTFCTVLKPQPTYILQSTNDLSMYSNWKTPINDAPGSDLTSRMMLSLYEMRRRVETPSYINSCRPVSILTHSSYWNGVSPPSPAPPIVTTRHSIPSGSESKLATKSPSEPDLISVALNEVEVTCENVSSEIAVPSGSRIVRLLHESVAPPMDTPKRVVIFSGGYKTSEEYVYVRGRGRGHYVCERCGIRCKKPSMLKKHIRTHTDLRPYHCYYCSFSFKTKGNLTKHMKSKAHHKKCLELGIFPIPTVVDETHIDSSALDQQNQVAEESRILGACVDDTDGSHLTDDNDGDDDDNDDDEEEDDDTESEAEMVIDDDVDSVNSRSEVQYVAMVPDGSTEAAFLKMKAGVKTESKRENVASGNTKFTLGQVKGQPPRASIDKEIAASLLDLSKGTDDVCKMTTTAESGLASTRCSSGHTGVVGPVTSVTCESVGIPRSMNQREDTTVSTQCCSPPAGGTTEGTPTSVDEVPDHISPASRIWLDNMRAFCERAHTHPPKTENDCNIGARFVPPLPLGGTPTKMSTESTNFVSVHRPIISSASGGPIIGHFIKQDVSLANILNMTVTDTVSSAMALPVMMTQSSAVTLQTACITTAVSHVNKSTDTCVNETPVTDDVVKQTVQHTQPDNVQRTTEYVATTSVSVETVAMPSVTMATTAIPTVAIATMTTAMTQPAQTIPFHLLGLHGLPAVVPSEIPLGVLLVTTASTTPSTSSTATVVQFVTGDNRAPYEIIPIPGRVNDNSASLVDGKYVCHVCGKTFPKQHQLTLHKNIHYFERPFKCTDCSLSFRTKGHLEKHHKSEGHQLKVKVAERSQVAQVTVTGGGFADNPRPFRCDDCNVAFRIHGHLAKHLRSKLHIMMLEKLGKVPPGAYALIEKNGSFKEVIATDCETSLQCIRRLLVNLDGGGSTSHSTCDSGLLAHVPAEISQSAVTNSGQTGSVSESAVNSFTYCRAGEFEKVTNASNDRVTVERKAELIDFGEFVPETETVSQLTGEDRAGLVERDREGGESGKDPFRGTCATAAVEHQCSLCSSDFPDISSLKQHLVTHTELRPYVCEYCDAGFTTAQSLTFHLRTHTQERPYLCGRCGDTFARLSQLQQHSLVHTSQSLGGATAPSPDRATPQSLDGATSQSLGGATSQSLDGTTSQPLDGATSDSPGGAPSHLPGGATQTAAVAMVTASLYQEVAINKDRVERMLPPSGGDVSREGVSDGGVGGVCRQADVSETPGSGEEGDTPVTATCVDAVSGVSVTNNNTATVDTHRYPVSVAMVTTAGGITASVTATSPSQPSENHVSKTPLNPASKRRCLQRQYAMTGEDVTMATATTLSSNGATCVTTAATVTTPVEDIGQCSSSQHSYDQTEQSENVPCSSSVP